MQFPQFVLPFLFFFLVYSMPQQQRRTNYQEPLAFQLLHLAAAAYGNQYDECITRSFPQQEGRYVFSATEVACDEIGSTCSMFIVVSNVTREAIIVFRGTKSDKRPPRTSDGKSFSFNSFWKEDSLMRRAWSSIQWVNKYFNNAHNSMWPDVLAFFSRVEFQSYALTITGHSLGGALAALSAARIVHDGYRSSQMLRLYTFGEPRVGSYEFAMYFDSLGIESYRVVFQEDVIPHQPGCHKDPTIPPNANGSRSRACLADASNPAYHHGIEIWYSESMILGQSNYSECLERPRNEDMECSDQILFKPDSAKIYAWYHRHYFNLLVTGYGKSGCTNTTVDGPPEKMTGLLSRLSDALADAFKLNNV